MTSQQSILQQVAELEEKTNKLKVDVEKKEFEKEEEELNKALEETKFLRLTIPGPIGAIAKHCDGIELIRLAATCNWIRVSLFRDCDKFRQMGKKLDLEELNLPANKENLIDISRALPGLTKLKLGKITSSRIMKYLGRFKKLRQLEITLKRNHYFSGDRLNVDNLKIRNEGGSDKNVVQLLKNFRGLKCLKLYHVKLTPDILRAVHRHKKDLGKLAFINCNERLKPENDRYIYELAKLRHFKILNLFCRSLTHSFESRYVRELPHQLQLFEIDRIFENFDVQKMRAIPEIRIQYYVKYIEDEQDALVRFFGKLEAQPISVILQDGQNLEGEDRIFLENFFKLITDINPLIRQKVAKYKS